MYRIFPYDEKLSCIFLLFHTQTLHFYILHIFWGEINGCLKQKCILLHAPSVWDFYPVMENFTFFLKTFNLKRFIFTCFKSIELSQFKMELLPYDGKLSCLSQNPSPTKASFSHSLHLLLKICFEESIIWTFQCKAIKQITNAMCLKVKYVAPKEKVFSLASKMWPNLAA